MNVTNGFQTPLAIRPQDPAVFIVKETVGNEYHSVVAKNSTSAGYVVLDPAVGVVFCKKNEVDEMTTYAPYQVLGGQLESLPAQHRGDIEYVLLVR